MSIIRSGNPVLKEDTFTKVHAQDPSQVMTIQGTVNKTIGLLFLVVLGAALVWDNPQAVAKYLLPAVIGGFVVGLITVFKKDWAKITAPIYAAVEGVILGVLSSLFEKMYPGIVIQAVGLTFGTLFALLLAYKSGIIKATENFRLGVVAATGGIALYYLASFILGFFGITVPLIHDSGPWGIAFSVFVVIIAALNLVLDFDFIEKGSQRGAPKYMEWYGAFGLLVTLIWLYLEILRLLAKSRRR